MTVCDSCDIDCSVVLVSEVTGDTSADVGPTIVVMVTSLGAVAAADVAETGDAVRAGCVEPVTKSRVGVLPGPTMVVLPTFVVVVADPLAAGKNDVVKSVARVPWAVVPVP